MRVLDAFISFVCAIIVLVLAVSVILVFTDLHRFQPDVQDLRE